MAGDNSLEGYVRHDLDELEAAVSASRAAGGPEAPVRVAVLADRIEGWADDDGDWTGTRRYVIGEDVRPGRVDSPWEDLGELDMGDPRTLEAFLAWGRATAPSAHTALILWNHGYAWSVAPTPPPSIAGDDTSGTELSIAEGELASALDAHVAESGPLDLLAFDACYMASWEVSHAMRAHARVLVGSEGWVGGEGILYAPMLGALGADPGIPVATLAADMAEGAVAAGEQTFSAVDLTRMDALAEAVDALSQAATPARIRAWQQFGRTMEPGWSAAFLDLRALGELAARGPAHEAGANVAEAVQDAVIASFGDDSHAWAGGLTIFAATSPPSWLDAYAHGDGASWAEVTGWDEALQAAAAQER